MTIETRINEKFNNFDFRYNHHLNMMIVLVMVLVVVFRNRSELLT